MKVFHVPGFFLCGAAEHQASSIIPAIPFASDNQKSRISFTRVVVARNLTSDGGQVLVGMTYFLMFLLIPLLGPRRVDFN